MTKATLPGRYSTARKTTAIDRELARFEAASAAFAAAARAAGVPQTGQEPVPSPVRSDARVLLSVVREAPRSHAATVRSFQDTQQGPMPAPREPARTHRRAASRSTASTALEWFGSAPGHPAAHAQARAAASVPGSRPAKARTWPAVLLSSTVAAALAAALVPSFALRNPAAATALLPRAGVALVAQAPAAAPLPAAAAAVDGNAAVVATIPAAEPGPAATAPSAATMPLAAPEAAPVPVGERAQAPRPAPARAVAAAIVRAPSHDSTAAVASAQERADLFLIAPEPSAPVPAAVPEAAPAPAPEAAPQ